MIPLCCVANTLLALIQTCLKVHVQQIQQNVPQNELRQVGRHSCAQLAHLQREGDKRPSSGGGMERERRVAEGGLKDDGKEDG